MIRVAVVGVGSMGHNHVLRYSDLPEVELVAIVEPRAERAAQYARQFSCHAFVSIDDLFTSSVELDAVSIVTPTAYHSRIATSFLERGVHCLVEKPLADSSEKAQKLVDLAEQNGLVLLPGHVERFNPAVRAIRDKLSSIEYIKSYRVGPMSFRSIDTDVVMDLMTHDLDLVLHLCETDDVSIDVTRAVIGPKKLNDIANVHLRVGKSCFADLTASRFAIAKRRKMRIFCRNDYFSIDCTKGRAMRMNRGRFQLGIPQLKIYQELGREPSPDEVFRHLGAEILVSPGNGQYDALEAELRFFIECIHGKFDRSLLTANDGVRVIKLAEKIQKNLRDRGETKTLDSA